MACERVCACTCVSLRASTREKDGACVCARNTPHYSTATAHLCCAGGSEMGLIVCVCGRGGCGYWVFGVRCPVTHGRSLRGASGPGICKRAACVVCVCINVVWCGVVWWGGVWCVWCGLQSATSNLDAVIEKAAVCSIPPTLSTYNRCQSWLLDWLVLCKGVEKGYGVVCCGVLYSR